MLRNYFVIALRLLVKQATEKENGKRATKESNTRKENGRTGHHAKMAHGASRHVPAIPFALQEACGMNREPAVKFGVDTDGTGQTRETLRTTEVQNQRREQHSRAGPARRKTENGRKESRENRPQRTDGDTEHRVWHADTHRATRVEQHGRPGPPNNRAKQREVRS